MHKAFQSNELTNMERNTKSTAFTETLEGYIHQLGPDYILPTENIRTWHRDGATRIQTNPSEAMHQRPISIPTAFKKTVDTYSDKTAFYVERDFCSKWSFRQFYDQVRIVSKAFIRLGLKRFGCVCILGHNSPEWIIAEVAAMFAGGMAAGIYPTNFPDACKYILNDSEASICLVDNDFQLQKILEIKSELPHLLAIVQWLGTPTKPDVISWDQLLNIGRGVPYDILEQRLKGISINEPCFISYTSGTLGQPKAALLSHDALIHFNWQCCIHILKLTSKDKVVSYLPMNHMGAQAVDVFPCILLGSSVHFAKPDALKGSLVDSLILAQPTVFFAVPRIWEKMYEKFKSAEKQMSFPTKAIFAWARQVGAKHSRNTVKGNYRKPIMYNLAKKLVLGKVKSKIGLSETRYLISAAAPIDVKILEYLWSLDMPVLEAYGLTETLGCCSLNAGKNIKLGSVGKADDFLEIKLDSVNGSGEGEICYRGRNIFMGYMNKEKDSKETIDDEAWLHTGDIGRIDNEGFLYITGRKKEILITSGGENIAPVPIEDQIKRELDIISNAMVIGDKRKFLSVVLTLKTNLDVDGNSTGILTDDVQMWLRDRGCNATRVDDVLSNIGDSVWSDIQEGIDATNRLAVSNASKIQKWVILPRDFSTVTGEFGPTLKLRRNVVLKNYENLLDSLYKN